MSSDPRPALLVVDDEQRTLDTLKYAFDEDFRIILCSNSAEALRALENGPFDVALIDIKMERESGLDLLRVIRRRDPGLQAIILSGYATTEHMQSAFDGAAFGFHRKPFDLPVLTDLLRQGAALSRTLRAAAESGAHAGGAQGGGNALLAGVLHDIRNLLTVPRARLELLVLELERRSLAGQEAKPWLAGELGQIIGAIDAATELASSHFGDPGKRPNARITPQEAAGAIGRALQILRSDPDLKHVTFRADVGMAPMASIGVSSAALFHLVLNLARNGAQASIQPHNVQVTLKASRWPSSPPPGSAIQIGAPREGAGAAESAGLTVADDASGIEEQVMQRLFREPVSTKRGGTGAGLMFVKHLVIEAAAIARLESKLGRGTTAAIYFRLLEP